MWSDGGDSHRSRLSWWLRVKHFSANCHPGVQRPHVMSLIFVFTTKISSTDELILWKYLFQNAFRVDLIFSNHFWRIFYYFQKLWGQACQDFAIICPLAFWLNEFLVFIVPVVSSASTISSSLACSSTSDCGTFYFNILCFYLPAVIICILYLLLLFVVIYSLYKKNLKLS